MLKVSPQKGVIRFEKRGKLNPRYIGPFKILKRVGPEAYKLELSKEHSFVQSTFYVSNLKKCLSDKALVIPMKAIWLDDNLNFMEEPIEIMDREVNKLRQSPLKNDLRKFKGKDIVDNSAQVSNAATIAPGIDTCPDIQKPSEKLVAVMPVNKNKTVREPIPLELVAQEYVVTKVYTRRPKVVKIILWYLDSGCSEHMIGDRSQLTNFVHKFLGIVKFDNKKIVKIMWYGDYQIGNITILRVYFVEGLGHNLFSVGKSKSSKLCSRFTWVKFLASKDKALDFIIKYLKMIQVRLTTPVRNIRTDNGTEFVNQTLRSYYEIVGPGLQSMALATSSSRLVTNPIHQEPCNPSPRDDSDRLFQPMFDEYFNPPTIAVSLVPVANAPRVVDLANSPVSMSIDQDAPSTNLTSHRSSFNVRPIHTLFKSLGRWTKDNLIANVIGDPSHFVSTRKHLQIDAMWCYFDAFLTSVEPKNYKQEMTKPSWIDAMQEEIHEY
nr:reverse transcriptase domain-containing protein [Tanacetum cinerariifolium]